MNEFDPRRQHYNVTLVVLVVSALAFATLQSAVVPALPEIQRALNTSETSVSWLLTGYLLSASVATPIAGRLGDMFGKERMLVIVLVLLAVGTVLAALATSIGLMIVARVIQGIGGGVFPLSFGIIRDEFPREKVAGGIGLLSAIMGVGGGLGLVLAGAIVDALNYHWLFWLPLLLVVPAAIAAHLFIPESPVKSPARINWLGAVLMSAGISAVLIAITEASDWGWTSARTLGLFAAGALLVALWIRAELRAEEPLIDMRMMQIRGVWTTNTVAFLLGAGMYSSFVLVPQLIELPAATGHGFGASVTTAGLYMLPATVFIFLLALFAGRLEARFGSKPPLIAGTAAAGASFLLLAISHAGDIEILVAMSLLGAGIGLSFAAMANLIVQSVAPTQTGVATGMNTVMRTLGGAVGGQVVASILSGHIGAGGVPEDSGFTLAFVFCAGSLALAVLAGLVVPGRRRDRRSAGDPALAEISA